MRRDEGCVGYRGCARFRHSVEYRKLCALKADGHPCVQFPIGKAAKPPPRYDPLVRHPPKSKLAPGLPLDLSLLKPGLRLAVALSGGADSVALLRILAGRSGELGLALHAAHLHHGLRGAEADGDLAFCRELAAKLGLPFHEARVDTAAEAQADPKSNKAAETIEEAARRLRYAWFRQLMASGEIDAVATAHTLDDQAETVLAKFLRGAWTEGLAGIHPKLETPEGRILRPLLAATHAEIEAYLRAIGQDWREDTSNRHLTFTRNRIRHELLPLLEGWNPRLREHLAQMAAIARDEEAWWQSELARLAPQLLLPGRSARGGGRAAGGGLDAGLAIEVSRLAVLAPALQRRLLRHAAEQFRTALDFAATEAVRSLALVGRAGQKLALPQGLRAERTARELRLAVGPGIPPKEKRAQAPLPEYSVSIPGEIEAPAFGLRLRVEVPGSSAANGSPDGRSDPLGRAATLRNWKPGDRVRLRYSSGLRKVKEVLERLRVTGTERAVWPVLEVDGRIIWMRGVELEREPGLVIQAAFAGECGLDPPPRAGAKHW
jgi:tRNA(Ile)-lysidine synthase